MPNASSRLAIGDPDEVTIIDGTVSLIAVHDIEPDIADAFAKVSHDPRVVPGFVYLRLEPRRVLVWNGFHEYAHRTVMRRGKWLD